MNYSTSGSQVPARMGGVLVMNIEIGGFHYIDGGAQSWPTERRGV